MKKILQTLGMIAFLLLSCNGYSNMITIFTNEPSWSNPMSFTMHDMICSNTPLYDAGSYDIGSTHYHLSLVQIAVFNNDTIWGIPSPGWDDISPETIEACADTLDWSDSFTVPAQKAIITAEYPFVIVYRMQYTVYNNDRWVYQYWKYSTVCPSGWDNFCQACWDDLNPMSLHFDVQSIGPNNLRGRSHWAPRWSPADRLPNPSHRPWAYTNIGFAPYQHHSMSKTTSSDYEYYALSHVPSNKGTSVGDLPLMFLMHDVTSSTQSQHVVKSEIYNPTGTLDSNGYYLYNLPKNTVAPTDGLTIFQATAGNTNYTAPTLLYRKTITIPANGITYIGMPFGGINGVTLGDVLPELVKNGIEFASWDTANNVYLTNKYLGFDTADSIKLYSPTGLISFFRSGSAGVLINKRSTNYTYSIEGTCNLNTKHIIIDAGKNLLCYPHPFATDLTTNGFPWTYGDICQVQGSSGWTTYVLDDIDMAWNPCPPPVLSAGQPFYVQKVAATNWVVTNYVSITLPSTITVKGSYANPNVTGWYGITCAHGKTHAWNNFYDRVTICSDDVVYAFNETGTGSSPQTTIIVSGIPSMTLNLLSSAKTNTTSEVNFYAGQRQGVKITKSDSPFSITVADPPSNWTPPNQQSRVPIEIP